jgi:hypothetical protein
MKHVPVTKAQQLTDIPGVGRSIARDLELLGYRKPVDLRGEDPQAMYDRLTASTGRSVDRCILYVFRTAVYYASTAHPEPDKLLWWTWKDA